MADRESEPFEQLVLAALATLPAEFTAYLQNVEVLVERHPSHEQRRALGLQPSQTLYGLYQGVPLTQRSHQMILLPDTITLFQEPLERDFPHPDALREQVRRTVLHEIAHVFGISDQRLRELGAY